MGHKFVALSELCSEIYRYPTYYDIEYIEKGVPEVRGALINEDGTLDIDSNNWRFISEETSSKFCRTVLLEGDLVISVRGTIGKIGLVPDSLSGANMTANLLRVSPDSSKVDGRYLWRFMRSDLFMADLERVSSSTTIKTIKSPDIKAIKIPLPPIATQKHIAAILDQAEELRSKRRSAIALLDELGRSVFLEMFGDPVTNPKEWNRIPLGELLSAIESGKSPNCLDRPVAEGEWGVLKLGAVTWCEYNSSENKALPLKEKPDPVLEVKPGDLLFTRKNTYELVAACVLVRSTPPNLLLPDLIFRFRLKSDAAIDLCFLHQLLINPNKRREIQKLASGSSSSMPNISKSKLQITLIEVPPLELQQQFAKRIGCRVWRGIGDGWLLGFRSLPFV